LAGGAQVIRGSAQLSGGVQPLLLRVARSAHSPARRQPRAGAQPPLPAVQLRDAHLPADVQRVDVRQRHAQVQVSTSAGRRGRAGAHQRIHAVRGAQKTQHQNTTITVTLLGCRGLHRPYT